MIGLKKWRLKNWKNEIGIENWKNEIGIENWN
jgi:hypothetical protein